MNKGTEEPAETGETLNHPAMTPLLNAAFFAAMGRWSALHEQWVRISFKIGGLLPGSLFMCSVQDIGRLDMILRTLEDEWKPNISTHFFGPIPFR
jgi:hypothetical protein